jgi:hypothetical protein
MWLAGGALAVAFGSPLVAEQPQPMASETQLSASVAHTATGSRVTFTVHVSPSGSNANASGVVTIVDGGLQIGSAVLNADGDASIESSGLLPGTHSVHALYSGSGKLAGSVSPEAQIAGDATADATGGAVGFRATASPTALNVAQGNSISTTITLTPQNGFSNYVSLSCTGLPLDSTCTFLPVNVFVSGTAASTSVLSIETYGPTGQDAMLRTHSPLGYAFVIPGMLGIAGLGLRKRGRRWQNMGLMLLLFAGLGAIGGCSQRYHYLNRPPVASTGTPLGSTKINIEAQAISGVVVTTDNIPNVVLTVQAPAS